ncbi:hypothetical protein [Chengkuizengella sediminis]|uniref:hypothetical protein n=1 Tax=Chengkuizengella sediminis TaxID=1885917 RepID=UPI00138A2D22|nr:hypothetical protein [Chengkuizengella sediminis]NDI33853.1 hypothetical protein [Chengkuizengella sediminis]
MEKKEKKTNEYKLFYNSEGEKVDPFEIEIREDECQNFIDFCCIANVPDGFFKPDFTDPTLEDFCIDISELKCCLETQKVEATVNNPCNGELTCLTEIQAVRLVGCVRITANTGPILPIQSPFAVDSCTVNCSTTVCVDQILDFTCNQTPPCIPCYEIEAAGAIFAPLTDACGREVVRVQGRIFLKFVGCGE